MTKQNKMTTSGNSADIVRSFKNKFSGSLLIGGFILVAALITVWLISGGASSSQSVASTGSSARPAVSSNPTPETATTPTSALQTSANTSVVTYTAAPPLATTGIISTTPILALNAVGVKTVPAPPGTPDVAQLHTKIQKLVTDYETIYWNDTFDQPGALGQPATPGHPAVPGYPGKVGTWHQRVAKDVTADEIKRFDFQRYVDPQFAALRSPQIKMSILADVKMDQIVHLPGPKPDGSVDLAQMDVRVLLQLNFTVPNGTPQGRAIATPRQLYVATSWIYQAGLGGTAGQWIMNSKNPFPT